MSRPQLLVVSAVLLLTGAACGTSESTNPSPDGGAKPPTGLVIMSVSNETDDAHAVTLVYHYDTSDGLRIGDNPLSEDPIPAGATRGISDFRPEVGATVQLNVVAASLGPDGKTLQYTPAFKAAARTPCIVRIGYVDAARTEKQITLSCGAVLP